MSLFPCWAEALNAWLSREGAVGSDDICCSSVIISATLPGTLWVGWQWCGGQSKPTEELWPQQYFQGLCGVVRSPCELPAPLSAYLTSLPCPRPLSTPSSRFKGLCSSRAAHIPPTQSFMETFSLPGWGLMHSEAIETSKKLYWFSPPNFQWQACHLGKMDTHSSY